MPDCRFHLIQEFRRLGVVHLPRGLDQQADEFEAAYDAEADDPIDSFPLEEFFHGNKGNVRITGSYKVHRISPAPERRKMTADVLDNPVRERRNEESPFIAFIRRNDSPATSKGHDPHPVPSRKREGRETRRKIQQLRRHSHFQQARLPACSPEESQVSTHGAGVRGRGDKACFRAPPFQKDHRFDPVDPLSHLVKAPSLAHVFQIENDDSGRFVMLQVFQVVRARDHGLIP